MDAAQPVPKPAEKETEVGKGEARASPFSWHRPAASCPDLNRLFHNVARTPLGLEVTLAQVFTDDAERQELDAAQNIEGYDDRSPP
jgi:hypothetical protein